MAKDARLLFFSDASLARTTAANRTQVGDIIYLGHDHDLGPGTPIWVNIIVTTAAAGTGAIMDIDCEVADEVAFNATNEIVWELGPQPITTHWGKGFQVRFVLKNKGKPYIRLCTTATVANLTTAVGTAGVEIGAQEAGEARTPVTP